MINNTKFATITTDGSYDPQKGVGGFAYIIKADVDDLRHTKYENYGHLPQCLDAAEAEQSAILFALTDLINHGVHIDVDVVVVNSDNMQCVRAFQKGQLAVISTEYLDTWDWIKGKMGTTTLKFKHVAAHQPGVSARNFVNDQADKYAKAGRTKQWALGINLRKWIIAENKLKNFDY